ncbi:hypothetical protein Nepgr_012289 [Nepenthes gracilis]|uniref:Uncharacterized protein n=1 Tax=Nepenthes gracilis TaxID=150966 RepID=A0AAD3SFR5_NEPGR|nr:hypothetical protein Nepgr_012289 [Nepenthes gracilis]
MGERLRSISETSWVPTLKVSLDVAIPKGDAGVPSAEVLPDLPCDAPEGIGDEVLVEAQEEEAHSGPKPACHPPASATLDSRIDQSTGAKEASGVERQWQSTSLHWPCP